MGGFPRWIRRDTNDPAHSRSLKSLSSLIAKSPSQQEPTEVGPGAGGSKTSRVLPEPRRST